MLLVLMGVAMHAQSTQNTKFAKSLQYFKKKGGIDKDKHQAFLKVDVTGFGKQGKSSSKYLKLKVCKIFAIYQERMRNEVDFFLWINIKVFWKLRLSLLMGAARHAQYTETILHYLRNISRKKIGIS